MEMFTYVGLKTRGFLLRLYKKLGGRQPSKKLGWKFIGPFKFKNCTNKVTVELDLPKNLKSQMTLFPIVDLWHLQPAQPLPLMVDGELHQEFGIILDSKLKWRQVLINGGVNGVAPPSEQAPPPTTNPFLLLRLLAERSLPTHCH